MDLILTSFPCAVADVENVEKFDLAMRSNKWEGEDEEEEVKVIQSSSSTIFEILVNSRFNT